MNIQKLFYIGSMQTADECARNPWCSEAMNVTQLELMNAFHQCGIDQVTGIGFPGSSSRNNPQRIKHQKNTLISPHITIHEPAFIAFGPLQILTQFLSLLFYLFKSSRPDAILVTNPLSRLCIPAFLFGWKWQVPVVILTTDLSPASTNKPFWQNVRQALQRYWVRTAPGIVVYSAHVGRELRKNRPWVRTVRPPALDVLNLPDDQYNSEEKNVYFSGTMDSFTGVDLILQTIKLIPDTQYRFWFSGRGPLDDQIRKLMQNDQRIIHHGFVTRQQYGNLLQRATVLINPRPVGIPESRYSFPSKLIEYLAAGRPIISTAASDISEYYQDVIILLDKETPERLAELIQMVCDLPIEQRAELGKKAKASVSHESWIKHAEDIVNLMEQLQ